MSTSPPLSPAAASPAVLATISSSSSSSSSPPAAAPCLKRTASQIAEEKEVEDDVVGVVDAVVDASNLPAAEKVAIESIAKPAVNLLARCVAAICRSCCKKQKPKSS